LSLIKVQESIGKAAKTTKSFGQKWKNSLRMYHGQKEKSDCSSLVLKVQIF
jgi:hypothetical protein